MGHLSAMLKLARSLSMKKGKSINGDGGRETAKSMEKEAKKNELILKSSGFLNVDDGSKNLASLFSKKGEKGVNQDCFIVWKEFGCQEDMTFCGVFDGHGPWGHFVAKKVRETLPSYLLCNWQEETLAESSSLDLSDEVDLGSSDEEKCHRFDIWKRSYLRTFAAVDQELEQDHGRIDSFYSGTTALTIVRQGEVLYVANVGDSRAVLATTAEDDGSLVAVQLTVDFKPTLPEEAERIVECKGRVFSLEDEPGVERVWLPHEESPGLAMSRAFGDYCIKDYGLISEPQVTLRHISSNDRFVILATDGVWDVISNQEAVEIVSSVRDQSKAAECLVKAAANRWRKRRKGIAMDDISVVCLFMHSNSPILCKEVVSVATKMV
ncbi:Probable protein phosphatase 2C 73 [Linum perenne]